MSDWSLKPLHLWPGREKRLLRGHRWVFSNEIAEALSDYEPGEWVSVFSAKGASLGSGYFNPKSLIAVRLLCRPGQEPGRELLSSLLEDAYRRRREFYGDGGCYRVVYGESDGLPGLVVDRYEDLCVYQISTLGMSRMEPLVGELLMEIFRPRALVFRHDAPSRLLEGLSLEKGVARGEIPSPFRISLEGLLFEIDPLEGQKTGFYLDQRENRKLLKERVQGKKVLDAFCYEGSWALAAGSWGAREVVGVDQSERAVGRARTNASINNLEGVCRFETGEAFGTLKRAAKEDFDVIVVDPPAFAKSKSVLKEALKGYTDLNRRALLALKPGGLLATSSCSHHVDESLFEECLVRAAQAAGRSVRLLEARSHAPDHPVLPAMPETRYLKCRLLEVF